MVRGGSLVRAPPVVFHAPVGRDPPRLALQVLRVSLDQGAPVISDVLVVAFLALAVPVDAPALAHAGVEVPVRVFGLAAAGAYLESGLRLHFAPFSALHDPPIGYYTRDQGV